MSEEEKIEVSKKDLEFLLDQARAFAGTYEGSSVEKYEADILRRVAEIMGFDPIEYTPSDFKDEYKHKAHIQGYTRPQLGGGWYTHYACKHCYQPEDHEVHKGE